MSTLGVVVFSLGGMKHIARCLESVRWADVVMVLHAGDGEPSIDTKADPAPVLRKITPTVELRKLYQEIKTDWILHLWGEERVGAELQGELRALCGAGSAQAPLGYRIPIRSRLLGRWVQGSLWGTSPALRLSREVGEFFPGWWNATEERIRGETGLLQSCIEDYTSTDLGDGVDQIQSVASFWAERLQARGRSRGAAAMTISSLQVFMRLLFMNGVFSNGLGGLTLATLAAYAAFLSDAKVWEARNVGDRKKGAR